jgi:hypothetical protein
MCLTEKYRNVRYLDESVKINNLEDVGVDGGIVLKLVLENRL